jgi:epsin
MLLHLKLLMFVFLCSWVFKLCQAICCLQTLVDFQYMEASGKDQGINVRKKAQSLVSLINDKERIREVRQKANSNRDKYLQFCSYLLCASYQS